MSESESANSILRSIFGTLIIQEDMDSGCQNLPNQKMVKGLFDFVLRNPRKMKLQAAYIGT
jgi:hypothetical protein